jgi:uracil-DNA glycosylase
MPSSKPVLLVGEQWGENEVRIGKPFVGATGVELLRMLHDASVITFTFTDREYISRYYRSGDPKWINLIWEAHDDEVRRTNVFNIHPSGGKVEGLCGAKGEGIPGYPALTKSKYPLAKYASELDRLGDEILSQDPNLIVCLGNTPLWALTGRTGIGKLRGTTCVSSHCVAGYKLLVAYHPSAVLRQWELRSTTVADLSKILVERETTEVLRPNCEIYIEPDLDDVETFFSTHCIAGSLISVDIETAGTSITCIGFAPRRDLALVVPFLDTRKPGKSYWATVADERRCWELIRAVLENREVKKIFQNGLYDVAFLLRSYGIRTLGAEHDTMLLHHALQPESLKGLAFLGSLYTSHGPWKSERKGTTTIKRDE